MTVPRWLVHAPGFLVTVVVAAGAAAAADYAGNYKGDIKGQPSSVELTADGGGRYVGTIRVGSTVMSCRAAEQGEQLAGTFASGGNVFPFTAARAGDVLTLSTGGATYTLTRPAANPLAADDGGATVVGGAVAGTSELTRTENGRAVTVAAPTATTADAALDAALPGLARVVGGPITVGGRFVDSKQADRGGASFTSTVNGRAVRGVAFCGKSTAGGEDVSVAWCAADAPAAEWQALTAALPHEIKLQQYDFPDGTGSIGLADGWTCNAQSAADPVMATGPDGQNVVMGNVIPVNGKQSPLVRMMEMNRQMAERNAEQARRMGFPPPPPPPKAEGVFFGEFNDPMPLLQEIYPQLSEFLQSKGQPPRQIDRVLAATSVPAGLAGGRAQLISILWSEGATHYRSMGRLEADPCGTGLTLLMMWSYRAKVDRWDRDLPTLTAVAKSFKTNDQRLAEVGQQRCAAIAENGRKQMQAQQKAFEQRQALNFHIHQQQMDASAEQFDRFENSINAQSTASHRAAQDYAEMVGGYQKVVDTRTGEVMHVDYYDSTAIVQGLNDAAGDPHEFVAVHRRDEVYPLR